MVLVVSLLYCMGLTGWFVRWITRALLYSVSGIIAVLYGFQCMVCRISTVGLNV